MGVIGHGKTGNSLAFKLQAGRVLKKRVLIYGINYAPEIAGVGRYTGEIGAYMAEQGHDVTVVTAPPHYPGWAAKPGYSSKAWRKEAMDGATVYRCPLYLHSEMRGLRRLLAPLSFAMSSAPVAFFQILKRRPQVVMAIEPTLFVAPVALLAAGLVGARTVLHVQDLEVDAAFAVGHLGKGGLFAKAAAAFEQLVMPAFDQVITISHKMAEKIVAKGVATDRVDVIRNWVDLDQIKPQPRDEAYREELGLKANDFVVLYSGNLGAKQGVRLLIDAARYLSDRPNIVFVVAGDGPMRGTVAEAAEKAPNLRLLPFQPEARFADFLSIADLHVLPQERGAADLLLPSKLGGMLASGRAIIATADPDTELGHFLGSSCTLTPPGEARGLADAVATIAAAPYSHAQEADRLIRVKLLSKKVVIADFLDSALDLQDATAQASPSLARQTA